MDPTRQPADATLLGGSPSGGKLVFDGGRDGSSQPTTQINTASEDPSSRHPHGQNSSDEDFALRSEFSRPPPHLDRPPFDSAPKTTMYRIIEERDCTHLTDKFATLRDSVPSLRISRRRLESPLRQQEMGEEADGELSEQGMDQKDGTASQDGSPRSLHMHKLNEIEILREAADYILQLEQKSKELARENDGLKQEMEVRRISDKTLETGPDTATLDSEVTSAVNTVPSRHLGGSLGYIG